MTTTVFSTTDIQGVTLTGSNLIATAANATVTNFVIGAHADGKASGKWYVEFNIGATWAGGNSGIGFIRNDSVRTSIGASANNGFIVYRTGNIWFNGANTSISLGALGTSVFIYAALDLDHNMGWFKKAGGNWNNSGTADPGTNVGGINLAAMPSNAALPMYIAASFGSSGDVVTLNAGATTYNGTKPTGFSTWDIGGPAGTTYAMFSQVGAEVWVDNPANAIFTQVGLEVWRSVADAPGNTFSASFVERV